MSCDLSNPELVEAYTEIKKHVIDWFVLDYRGTRSKLFVYSKGNGGLSEMKEAMRPVDDIYFGMLRAQDQTILWSFIPQDSETVGGVRRARAIVHSRTLMTSLRDHSTTLTFSSVNDVTQATVQRKLSTLTPKVIQVSEFFAARDKLSPQAPAIPPKTEKSPSPSHKSSFLSLSRKSSLSSPSKSPSRDVSSKPSMLPGSEASSIDTVSGGTPPLPAKSVPRKPAPSMENGGTAGLSPIFNAVSVPVTHTNIEKPLPENISPCNTPDVPLNDLPNYGDHPQNSVAGSTVENTLLRDRDASLPPTPPPHDIKTATPVVVRDISNNSVEPFYEDITGAKGLSSRNSSDLQSYTSCAGDDSSTVSSENVSAAPKIEAAPKTKSEFRFSVINSRYSTVLPYARNSTYLESPTEPNPPPMPVIDFSKYNSTDVDTEAQIRLRKEEQRRVEKEQQKMTKKLAQLELEEKARKEKEVKQVRDAQKSNEQQAQLEQNSKKLQETRQREEEALKEKQIKLEQFRKLKEAKSVMLSGFVTAQSSESIYWKRRFFTLTDKKLLLYKSAQDDPNPTDSIELTEHTLLIDRPEETTMPNSIKIATRDEDYYLLYTDTVEDKDFLLNGLSVAC